MFPMFHDVILWMGSQFGAEQYVFWTRIQCSAWTAADYVIVFSLLRCGSVARRLTGRPVHFFAWFLLAATVPFAALIPVSAGMLLFAIELLVTIPHFALILYVLIVDAPALVAALKILADRSEGNAPCSD